MVKLEEIDEYHCIGPDRSTLDGRFTAEELRLIADEMDKRKEQEEE